MPGYGVATVRCTISGTRQRPLAHRGEALLVPDGSAMMLIATVRPSSRAISSACEVLVGRHALAVQAQRLLVEGLDAEEHVVQAEPLPVREDLPVLDQDVAARLEVVLLADAAALDLAADGEAVLGLDERDVVDEEHVGLADPREVLAGGLRRDLAIAPPVERPRAAERAVPRAAARELGRRARVEHADEVACRRRRARSRAGRCRSRSSSRVGLGPGAVPRDHARQRARAARSPTASSSAGAMTSPSPRTTQSMAPAGVVEQLGAR